MSLRIVGDFNKLSEKALAAVPKLGKGQKVIFKLLNPVIDPRTKEKFFGGYASIRCRDTIKDIGTGEIVEIGIPTVIFDNRVTKCKKHILNGGGQGGLVGEFFELWEGRVADEQLYTFLSLCNANGSNPNRDTSKLAKYERVNPEADAQKKTKKRDDLLAALLKFKAMTNKDVVRFAAAQNWDEKKDIDLLRDDVGAYAQATPSEFLKKVSGGQDSIKADIKLAASKGIISFDPVAFKWVWAESGSVIAIVQKDGKKDELELFADWIVATKNGNNVHEAINSLFDNLVKSENKGQEVIEEEEEAAAPIEKAVEVIAEADADTGEIEL